MLGASRFSAATYYALNWWLTLDYTHFGVVTSNNSDAARAESRAQKHQRNRRRRHKINSFNLNRNINWMRVCACNICDTVCVNAPTGGTHFRLQKFRENLMKIVGSFFSFSIREIGNSWYSRSRVTFICGIFLLVIVFGFKSCKSVQCMPSSWHHKLSRKKTIAKVIFRSKVCQNFVSKLPSYVVLDEIFDHIFLSTLIVCNRIIAFDLHVFLHEISASHFSFALSLFAVPAYTAVCCSTQTHYTINCIS